MVGLRNRIWKWWIFDNEFGLNGHKAWDENGELISDLDTVKGIYDLLIQNYDGK